MAGWIESSLRYTIVSSAYKRAWQPLNEEALSFKKMVKRTGPKIEPCGKENARKKQTEGQGATVTI